MRDDPSMLANHTAWSEGAGLLPMDVGQPGVFASAPGSDLVIAAGQKYQIQNGIAAGYTLTIDGGYPGSPTGGEVIDKIAIVNDGVMLLDGGNFPTIPTYPGATGAYMRVTGTLTNYGAITIAAGSGSLNANAKLVVHGSLANDGVLTIESGAGGSSLPAPGGNLLLYGAMSNSGTITITAAGFQGGLSGQAGVLHMLGPSNLTNTGLISVEGSNGGVGARFLTAGHFTNDGTVDVAAGTVYSPKPPSGQYSPAGVLDVGTGFITNAGMINLAGGVSDSSTGVGFGAVEYQARQDYTLNNGVILLGGAYAASVASYGTVTGARFVQYGKIVNNDQILLEAAAAATGATAKVQGAIFIDSHGNLINDANITVQGSGAAAGTTPSATAAATLGENGVLANYGTLFFGGGASGNNAVAGAGAVLTIYGQQNVYGTAHMENYGRMIMAGGYRQYGGKAGSGAKIDLSGGTLTNAGYLELMAGQGAAPGSSAPANAASGPAYGFGATLKMTGGVVINTGTWMAGADNAGNGTGASMSIQAGSFKNRGTIELSLNGKANGAAAMTIGAQGALINNGYITGGGSLINYGTIASSVAFPTPSVITLPQLVNDGQMVVASNTSFIVNAAITATSAGTITLDLASTLTLGGAVSNQTVDLTTPGDKILLGDAAGFGGILEGLSPKDVLDFLNQDVTSAIATGTTLAIGLSSGTTLDLAMSTPLGTHTGIQLASDGNGGTDVNFVST